jgi:hypothetical protein
MRNPSDSVVSTIVRDYFETFRAESARLRDGDGLPRFVEDEFRAFLRCGFLAGGFARFRCGDCKTERLVAFSCKGRGFCPSCGGRRMAERAAHLVDHVLPDVPIRQWELFEAQPQSYRDVVLPPQVRTRISIEAAATFGWERYVGRNGASVGIDRFGASAPAPVLMREFGFTPEGVMETARAVLARTRVGGSGGLLS